MAYGAARAIAGAQPVVDERGGVVAVGRLVDARQRAVEARRVAGVEAGGRDLADPVVVRLDQLEVAGAVGPDQARRAQHRERRRLVADLGDAAEQLDRRGHARGGGRREQGARVGRQALHAVAQQGVEATAGVRAGAADGGFGQHREEQRVAVGLGDQRRHAVGLVARQQRARQREALVGVQRGQLQAADVADDAHRARRQRLDHRRASRLVGPVGGEQQHRRRVGPMDEVDEEAGAVAIAPLQVVEIDDRGLDRADRGQQLAQGAGRARAQPREVAIERLVRRLADRGDPVQRREQPGQRVDVDGQQRGGLLGRQLAQVSDQRVDQAIERLVRHGLALVAAAAQHQRAGLGGAVGEVLAQGALADPRRPAEQDRDAVIARRDQRVVERGQRVGAADERRGRARGEGVVGREAQPRAQLVDARAVARIARQQRHAQGAQITRQRRRVHVGCGRRPLELGGGDLGRGADERRLAGERLVEQHADAVPVAGLVERLAGDLLRRHVRGRPAAVVDVGAGGRAAQVDREAEVADRDPATLLDQHVRRLDVAMQDAGAVQGRQAFDQRRQHGAQAIEAQRSVGEPDRRPRPPAPARPWARWLGEAAIVVGARRGAGADVGAEVLEEAAALDQLHREEPLVAREQVIEGDQVGVDDVGEGAELVLEAVRVDAVDVAHGLERDLGLLDPVVDPVHDAHAAGAQDLPYGESIAKDAWLRHASSRSLPGPAMIARRMSSPVAPTRRWRWLTRLAPWVITAAVLVALLIQYPLGRIADEMARGDALAMAPVALIAIGVMWFVIAAGDMLVLPAVVGPIRYRTLLGCKAGVAMVNALGIAASYGGYAVWIQRRFRCRAGTAAGTVLFTTLTDLAAVASIASVALWLGGDVAGRARAELGVVTPIVAVVVIAILMIPARPGTRSLLEPWRRISHRARLAGLLVRTFNIGILIVATWAAARAFGMAIPLSAMLTTLPVLLVVGALPVNIAGFGPVQAAWVAMFAPWAPGAQVLAFQFLWHALMLIALLIRGAPFLRGVVADVAGGTPARA